MGSGCGSVGRAVTSHTRGPRFESRHRQIFIEHLFSTVNCTYCIEKTEIKWGREWPIFQDFIITVPMAELLLPTNVADLGKLFVAKGFKKLPKVQKIAKSGHAGTEQIYWIQTV